MFLPRWKKNSNMLYIHIEDVFKPMQRKNQSLFLKKCTTLHKAPHYNFSIKKRKKSYFEMVVLGFSKISNNVFIWRAEKCTRYVFWYVLFNSFFVYIKMLLVWNVWKNLHFCGRLAFFVATLYIFRHIVHDDI